MSSLKKSFKMNITIFYIKKKCIGTKSQEKNGSNLEIKILLSFIPKPSLEEKEIESTGFNSLMVPGLMIVLFSKMKLNITFRTFFAITSMAITTLSMMVITQPLMTSERIPSLAP
jgi:hypothetical protein